MTVSAIIIVHNDERHVGRALESVLRQTFAPLEVLVVDDCSTDGTVDVVTRVKDPRVRLLRHPANRGPSAARNTGIRAAQGEWISFLDSDDWWRAEKLERQVERTRLRPAAAVVYSWADVLNEKGEQVGRYSFDREGTLLPDLLRYNCVSGSSSGVTAKREALQAAGCFDETLRYSEDWDLWLRLAARFEYACVPAPLVCLTARDGSAASNALAIEQSSLLVLERAYATFAASHRGLRRQSFAWVHHLAATELERQGQWRPAVERHLRAFGQVPWRPRAALAAAQACARFVLRRRSPSQ